MPFSSLKYFYGLYLSHRYDRSDFPFNLIRHSRSLYLQRLLFMKKLPLLVWLIGELVFLVPSFSLNETLFIPASELQVVNGSNADISDYPWMGALVWSSSDLNTRQFCGCTAISPYWVMTAAHCVDDSVTTESFRIVFNTADLGSNENSYIAYPKAIYIHPDYAKSYNKDNDIALILLQYPLPDFVTTVPLITEPALENSGVTARLLGWGLTNVDFRDGTDTQILKEANLSVVSKEFANLPDYYNGRISDKMIVAGDFNPFVSSGSGDSGGPLLSYNFNLNRWEQIGISSFAAGCNKPNNPLSVFTSVSQQLDWITGIIENDFLSWTHGFGLPNITFEEGDSHRPLMEYVLGLNPTIVDDLPFSKIYTDDSNPNGDIFGEIRLRSSVPPINLRREWSRNLDDWNVLEIDRSRLTKQEDPATKQTVYSFPISGRNDEPGFYRVGHEDNRGIIHSPQTLRIGSSATAMFNKGPIAYGITSYDFLLDTMESLNPIRISGESEISEIFSIRVIEVDTGRLIWGWSESGRFDSPSFPFADIFTPEEGKQYLARVSSLNWTQPQSFRIRTEFVIDEIELVPATPHTETLSENDLNYKRSGHYSDTFTTLLEANKNYKIEVTTDILDQIIFVTDPVTKEVLHEIDQQPRGETEVLLVHFENDKRINITVVSYVAGDTGGYAVEVYEFAETASIKPGEKVIGLITEADEKVVINERDYILDEVNLIELNTTDGVTLRITGYEGFKPAFGVFNTTTGETLFSARAECEDSSFFFLPLQNNNYRLLILELPGRVGDNYELELTNGDTRNVTSALSSSNTFQRQNPTTRLGETDLTDLKEAFGYSGTGHPSY